MNRWRLVTAGFLLLTVAVPLLAPFDELRRLPDGWRAWEEADRLLELALNSTLLTLGTLALVMPIGTLLAILLFRTDLPGRSLGRFLMVLVLFIPLPLVTASWQMAYGRLFPPAPGAAWTSGMLPAIWIHAVLALPWVVLLVGLGLRGVEPELEEDAMLALPPWAVLLRVTLRRASPSLVLAALFTALLTWNEIGVTDFMKVRTFGEEVYTQFVGTSQDEVARAVAVALPVVALTTLLTLLVLGRWRRSFPSRGTWLRETRVFPLGPMRWPLAALLVLVLAVVLGVPLAALVWRAGLHYATAASPGPPYWDGLLFVQRLGTAFLRETKMVGTSLALGLATGLASATLALWCCWLARGSRWFEAALWVLAAVLLAMPGPILGIGLHDALQLAFDVPGGSWLKWIAWQRPSPLPNLWVCSLRFFPLALAALWPLVRLVPIRIEEAAMLDGLGPLQRFYRVMLPLLWPSLLWTVLGVAVLTLGELSASKLVTTPGFTPLSHHVFMQMHASADTELAALCLMMLALVAAGGAAIYAAIRGVRGRLGDSLSS